MVRRDIVFRAGGYGLANRLRALVGYQALARLHGVPFHLCWVSDEPCQCSFEDLFETPINLLSLADLQNYAGAATVFHEGIWFEEIWKRTAAGEHGWPEYLHEVRRCLRQLFPRREILESAEEFVSAHHLSEAVGVHIRHTDNLGVYSHWASESPDFESTKISSLEGFTDMIREAIATKPVFLATDNAPIENRLTEIFPDLAVFRKPYTRTGYRTTPIASALTEMLILGRCRRIVGTYYSSYGKFSAIWAGTSYAEIIGRESRRNDFVDRMLQPPLLT